MKCDEVARVLATDGERSSEMLEHTMSCPSCRALLRADALLRGGDAAVAPLSDVVRRAAERAVGSAEPGPWRRAWAPAAWTLAGGAVVLVAAPRPDLDRAPGWLVATELAGFLLAFAGGVAVVVRPRLAHSRDAARLAYLAFAPVAFSVLSLLAVTGIVGETPLRGFQVWLATHLAPRLGAWVHHAACPAVGIALGSVVLAATLRAGERTSLTAPGLTGAVAGAAAAMSAGFVLFPFCASHAVGHALAAHAIPLVALIGAGALFGRRILAV